MIAMLSAEEETNAYERVLAVCENSIAEYTKFLEVSPTRINHQKSVFRFVSAVFRMLIIFVVFHANQSSPGTRVG